MNAGLLSSSLTQGDSLTLNASYTLKDFHFARDASYGDNRLPWALSRRNTVRSFA